VQEGFDGGRGQGYQDWYRVRIENICEHVSAADVLARHGVELRRKGAQAEQISCPFHGADAKPSAKYFPGDRDGRSQVWCFVCRERWDAIGLWKKFTGTERFSEVLRQLERAFGLKTPAPPADLSQESASEDPLLVQAKRLFDLCENRLREHRGAFEMMQHLKLGQLLDHQRFFFDNGQITAGVAVERLTLVLKRIAEVVRAKAPADP
jgi:CHC2 zinc finger